MPTDTVETEELEGMLVVPLDENEIIGFIDPAPQLEYADELDALL
jgi:hypothetical protein